MNNIIIHCSAELILYFLFLWDMNSFTQELANMGSGWLATTADTMATPVGWAIYFVIWLLIIFMIVWVVMWVIKWSNRNLNKWGGGWKRYHRKGKK